MLVWSLLFNPIVYQWFAEQLCLLCLLFPCWDSACLLLPIKRRQTHLPSCGDTKRKFLIKSQRLFSPLPFFHIVSSKQPDFGLHAFKLTKCQSHIGTSKKVEIAQAKTVWWLMLRQCISVFFYQLYFQNISYHKRSRWTLIKTLPQRVAGTCTVKGNYFKIFHFIKANCLSNLREKFRAQGIQTDNFKESHNCLPHCC